MMKRLSLILACVVLFSVAPAWAQTNAPRQETQLMGAVIKEQGVTFAVVVVNRTVLNDQSQADKLIQMLGPPFGNIPVILMAQDAKGTPAYYGRPDIAKFLSTVPADSIPWKKYTLSY